MKPAAAAWIAPLLSLSVVSATPALAAAGPLVPRAWPGHPSMAPAPAKKGAPAVIGSKDERAATAAANYEQNRPVEAALGFEGLWRDFPGELDFLFNAATSRFTAGHFAHALARTDEYLALKNIGAAERKAAEAQRKAAIVQTGAAAVTVKLAAPPEGDGAVEIVAQFVPRDSGDIRPELVFKPAANGATTLQLDPGVWTVRAQAAGYTADDQQIEVRKGQTVTVGLNLEPAPKDAPVADTPQPQLPREVPPKIVRRSQLGFGVAGGVVAAAGIGVVVAGSLKIGEARECEIAAEGYTTCVDKLAISFATRGAGLMVLGGGLGLVVGSLPWLAKDTKVRKKAWIAEAVIGGALAIGGGVVVRGFGYGALVDDLNSVPPADALKNASAATSVAGVVMLGFGAGTLVSAVTNLLIQRHHLNKVQVSPSAGRGQFGLSLSGRF